ncbi:MAG TPA: DEAD/DEAH box helicase [Candidatus Methylacidiphilales bacterium]|nr:DEAD/DEAH box helicase [Candidatus Methylacidiphilales bacterium]
MFSAASYELTPDGVLLCLDAESAVAEGFAESESAGLFALGSRASNPGADASTLYWKRLADHFIRTVCQIPESSTNSGSLFEDVPPPDNALLFDWTLSAPPMRGAEYLSPYVFREIWARLNAWTRGRIKEEGSIAAFLQKHAPAWSRVGRVTLHLAENKADPEFPFGFMASYSSGLSQSGRVMQIPLGKALSEYSGAGNKAALLKLLTPLNAAAKASPLIASLIEEGDIYHPLAWTPAEAYEFLSHVPIFEDAGLLVRLPNWWKKRGTRPKVAATIGKKKDSGIGLDAMLDFKLDVMVDGQTLTPDEIEALLNGDDGLVLFRGNWIEVNREQLKEALDHWKGLEGGDGLSFIEGMRMLAGAPADLGDVEEDLSHGWAFAQPDAAVQEMLARLASPEAAAPPPDFQATLRPYQARGLGWLWFCARTGLGACLADDMGLGKTIQVIATLLRKKHELPNSPPSLLVVPASLIGNWKREAAKFAPTLRIHVSHRSEGPGGQDDPAPILPNTDVVITTYGMLTRMEWPAATRWGWVILDEAQAIKNHGSRQSKAARRLKADARIAMTGTPVENHLGDLWSLFDFINPGLLGTLGEFKKFVKRLSTPAVPTEADGDSAANSATPEPVINYSPLRRLVAPYILRRLKTDKSIITDLPDKTEMRVFCGLSPSQARLYQQSANALSTALMESSETGIHRNGLVLTYLMRFKQICNHPDQVTKGGNYEPEHSAKFMRLKSLCEEIASRGEKVLVFTQFQEMTEPLDRCLTEVFGRRGLVLHGGTHVKSRQRMVEQFQRSDGPPYFVLSLKAGGTGLTLTAASHVVHFDRWWNPAVENQATDRAFRIGQKRNVLVHKFVTSGTLEEKIDALITDKQETADAILTGDGAEKALTEMSNAELLDFVRLDVTRAEIV